MTNLSLLIDDWDSILKLHIIEQALKENIGYSNKAVVFLLVVEGISSPEISSHHLQANPESVRKPNLPGNTSLSVAQPAQGKEKGLKQEARLDHKKNGNEFCFGQGLP